MTRIDFFRDNSGSIVRFECSGHTDYADSGSDIVCASVSAAVYSAINGIDKLLGVDFGYEKRDGYLFFVLPNEIGMTERKYINILLESMCLFLRELAEQYPDNVEISELEV